MSAALSRIAHKAQNILSQLDQLEMIPVSDLARDWRKSKRWIARNLPVIKLGPKSHRVRIADALQFQSRRTIQPIAASNNPQTESNKINE